MNKRAVKIASVVALIAGIVWMVSAILRPSLAVIEQCEAKGGLAVKTAQGWQCAEPSRR